MLPLPGRQAFIPIVKNSEEWVKLHVNKPDDGKSLYYSIFQRLICGVGSKNIRIYDRPTTFNFLIRNPLRYKASYQDFEALIDYKKLGKMYYHEGFIYFD